MTSYNKALGSMQSRIIPSMKRLKEMGAGSDNINDSDLLDIEESQDEKEDVIA